MVNINVISCMEMARYPAEEAMVGRMFNKCQGLLSNIYFLML